jgi:Holliday junction resolvasome RuvABC endonuclease subunit
MRFHASVERILSGVTERGVAEIMRQRNSFYQVFMQAQIPCNAPADLGDFDAVGESRAEQVALMVHENLSLVFQPTESGGMDDAVAVALKLVASMERRL